MPGFVAGLSGVEKVYLLCAVVGGALFLVRLVLLMIGHPGDADMAGGMDGDVPHEAADDSFRLLSVQSLTAFFMMFGLVGLALARTTRSPPIVSLAGALAAGAFTVFVIGRIFSGMRKLQDDGTLNPANAVGQDGTVYLTVKPRTGGQVTIPIQGRLQVFNAATEEEEAIQSGTPVTVVKVISGNVLVIRRRA